MGLIKKKMSNQLYSNETTRYYTDPSAPSTGELILTPATTAIPNAAWTSIPFSIVAGSDDLPISYGTGLLTLPMKGLFRFGVRLAFEQPGAACTYRFRIFRDGASFNDFIYTRYAVSTETLPIEISFDFVLFSLDSGDYRMEIYQDSGTPNNLRGSTANPTFFTQVQIRRL